ncbi:MAG: hypothetical protein AAFX99_08870 [Myxococcota bacterium]
MNTNTCPQCGLLLSGDSAFCPACTARASKPPTHKTGPMAAVVPGKDVPLETLPLALVAPVEVRIPGRPPEGETIASDHPAIHLNEPTGEHSTAPLHRVSEHDPPSPLSPFDEEEEAIQTEVTAIEDILGNASANGVEQSALVQKSDADQDSLVKAQDNSAPEDDEGVQGGQDRVGGDGSDIDASSADEDATQTAMPAALVSVEEATQTSVPAMVGSIDAEPETHSEPIMEEEAASVADAEHAKESTAGSDGGGQSIVEESAASGEPTAVIDGEPERVTSDEVLGVEAEKQTSRRTSGLWVVVGVLLVCLVAAGVAGTLFRVELGLVPPPASGNADEAGGDTSKRSKKTASKSSSKKSSTTGAANRSTSNTKIKKPTKRSTAKRSTSSSKRPQGSTTATNPQTTTPPQADPAPSPPLEQGGGAPTTPVELSDPTLPNPDAPSHQGLVKPRAVPAPTGQGSPASRPGKPPKMEVAPIERPPIGRYVDRLYYRPGLFQNYRHTETDRLKAPTQDAWTVLRLGRIDALVFPHSDRARIDPVLQALGVVTDRHDREGGTFVLAAIEGQAVIVWKSAATPTEPITILTVSDDDIVALNRRDGGMRTTAAYAKALVILWNDLADVVTQGRSPSRVEDAAFRDAAQAYLGVSGASDWISLPPSVQSALNRPAHTLGL